MGEHIVFPRPTNWWGAVDWPSPRTLPRFGVSHMSHFLKRVYRIRVLLKNATICCMTHCCICYLRPKLFTVKNSRCVPPLTCVWNVLFYSILDFVNKNNKHRYIRVTDYNMLLPLYNSEAQALRFPAHQISWVSEW